MLNRILFALALFTGGIMVPASAADTIKKIVITRLAPIENDTSGTVTYSYPYLIRVYYSSPNPESDFFGINWGEASGPQFPFLLQSGETADGIFYQEFGNVYQSPGPHNVLLEFFGPGVGALNETKFAISVPAKKAPKSRKAFRPRMTKPDPPASRAEEF